MLKQQRTFLSKRDMYISHSSVEFDTSAIFSSAEAVKPLLIRLHMVKQTDTLRNSPILKTASAQFGERLGYRKRHKARRTQHQLLEVAQSHSIAACILLAAS